MSSRLAGGLVVILFVLSGATTPDHTYKPKTPSENAGKIGTYQAKTSFDQYNYYVYVPASYSVTNPAGLHVYFHGQNGQNGAQYFGTWAKHFLDAYNLIGINMQYMDGDNGKDTSGKVEAAREAIEQTIADYKIVLGRGAVASFSGGGLPAGLLFSQSGRQAAPAGVKRPTTDWYFNHSSLYSSNFFTSIRGTKPMTWYIAVGSKEWTLAGLGSTGMGRMNDLLMEMPQSGLMDMMFYVIKDKGHTITDEDVAQSAKLFVRSDLALAPFLYAADFPEPELKTIVANANKHALGLASKSLVSLLAKPKLEPAVKEKAERIQKAINERVDKILALCKELSEEDPFLGDYYGRMFASHLSGHAKESELKPLLAAAKPKAAKINPLYASFAKQFMTFFTGDGKLKPSAENEQLLEAIKTQAGEKSELGIMADHYLLLKGDKSDKPDKPDKPGKPDKPDKSEKPPAPVKPDAPETPVVPDTD